jgi:hypothetical protein
MGGFLLYKTFEKIFKSYENRPSHVKGGSLLYKTFEEIFKSYENRPSRESKFDFFFSKIASFFNKPK